MKTDRSKRPVRVGVFDDIEAADRAVQDLTDAGFHKDAITVICPDCSPHAYSEYHREQPAGSHTKVAAASGSAIGAVLGGLAIATGIVTTGGAALLVAGPLLAGAAAGGVAGGLVGAMMTRGLEDEAANFYDQALDAGKILVGVEDDGPDSELRLATAESILRAAGADPLPMTKG